MIVGVASQQIGYFRYYSEEMQQYQSDTGNLPAMAGNRRKTHLPSIFLHQKLMNGSHARIRLDLVLEFIHYGFSLLLALGIRGHDGIEQILPPVHGHPQSEGQAVIELVADSQEGV